MPPASTPPYRWGSAISILYVAFRVSTANLSPITDCDEVYNYWEPLHFVLYGTGMQTWEYAPQYALRTYAYLLPMAAVAKCFQHILNFLPPWLIPQLHTLLLLPDAIQAPTSSTLSTQLLGSHDKPLLFAMLRSFLALVSSYSELSFLSAIYESISPNLAHWTALCSATAAGNFHASQAYLPSSTVMILWRLSAANQLKGHHAFSIFWGLLAVLAVGWPFCAVLFISTGFWALWEAGLSELFTKSPRSNKPIKQSWLMPVVNVLIRTALHAMAIQAVVMAVDFYHYGKFVSPIWNIFAYNAQSGGDELYGVEPLSYYVKNLALNFNLVAFLGVLALPLILLRKLAGKVFGYKKENSSLSQDNLKILVIVPMYIWMVIVFPRPHKEERFLFPIYPALCFGASIVIDEVFYALMKMTGKHQTPRSTSTSNLLIGLVCLSPCALISISRSSALYHYYSAPLALYRRLHSDMATSSNAPKGNSIAYVCTAGEWYRFPSSFFLPANAELGFLKSSFTGQLPQPFTEYGSKLESLSVQNGKFNDINKEEMGRYVNIEQCTYVVELVPSSDALSSEIPECLQYMNADSSGQWRTLDSFDYIDAESTSSLHRILFLPFARKDKVSYKKYTLYSRS